MTLVKPNMLPPGLVSNLQDVLSKRGGGGGEQATQPSTSEAKEDDVDSSKPIVLVTNGDGIDSPGLTCLVEALVREGLYNVHGLWLRLLKLGPTDDPLSSFEYGTILALIESNGEGIGGSGFVECIREHINSLKIAISRATSRSDWLTIRDALEVSAEMFKKDENNVSDYVQRHLISLSILEELRSLLELPKIKVYYMNRSDAEHGKRGYWFNPLWCSELQNC